MVTAKPLLIYNKQALRYANVSKIIFHTQLMICLVHHKLLTRKSNIRKSPFCGS